MQGLGEVWRVNTGVKPEFGKGVRIVLAALLPLVGFAAAHQVQLGVVAALGGLLVSLVDVGPTLRTRMVLMSSIAVSGAILYALGRSLGEHWWLALPAVFIVTAVAGMVVVYGTLAAALGLMLNIVFVLGIGMGNGTGVAAVSVIGSVIGFMVGGLSALLFAAGEELIRRIAPFLSTGQTPPTPITLPSLKQPLAQLRLGSPTVRFAVLRALGATIAAAVTVSLGEARPQWAIIPLLIVATPDRQKSVVMSAQLAVGTILGAVVADILVSASLSRLVMALVGVAVMGLAFSVREMSYALSTSFATFALLVLISIPMGGVSLAALRAFETLLGITIALAITTVAPYIPRVERTANAAG